jgi:hypothetical protein
MDQSDIQEAFEDGKTAFESEVGLNLIKPVLIWEYYALLRLTPIDVDIFAAFLERYKAGQDMGRTAQSLH